MLFPQPRRQVQPVQRMSELISGASYNISQDADGSIVIVGRAKTVKDLERLLRDLTEALNELLGSERRR